MYIHIGAGENLRDKNIIGIFDMDGKWDSETTREFLKRCERDGKTSSAGADLPRSFILHDNGITFSHISSTVLRYRSSGKGSL